MTARNRAAAPDAFRIVVAGAIAGLGTCLVYPLIVVVSLPWVLTVALASSMGPLLGVASWGLREFVTLHERRLAADVAVWCNVIAGALLTAMLLVQLAVRHQAEGAIGPETVGVWLGLDVAWDVYVGLGTFLFALSALTHPRLGRILGVAGLLIAAGLLVLNVATFPAPPAEAGLVDLGPLVGLWYLALTVQVLRSLGCARTAAAGAARAA